MFWRLINGSNRCLRRHNFDGAQRYVEQQIMIEQNSIFSQALDTVKAARNFIFLAVLIYFAAAIAGWMYPGDLVFLRQQFEELVQRFEGLGPFAFVARIFVHNLIASYLAMCFVVLFGIIPMTLAAFNGLMVGWFAGWMEDLNWMQLTVLLVPHGIFEWPAMFIAFGVGMWRGLGNFFSPVNLSWGQRWKKANIAYFIFVVPLLLVAAVIEGRYHFLEMLS